MSMRGMSGMGQMSMDNGVPGLFYLQGMYWAMVGTPLEPGRLSMSISSTTFWPIKGRAIIGFRGGIIMLIGL